MTVPLLAIRLRIPTRRPAHARPVDQVELNRTYPAVFRMLRTLPRPIGTLGLARRSSVWTCQLHVIFGVVCSAVKTEYR
jgi:hypothetical protein